MSMYHKVKRVTNLLYKGCEPHWQCTQCGDAWPFHCYSKADLEQKECPSEPATPSATTKA